MAMHRQKNLAFDMPYKAITIAPKFSELFLRPAAAHVQPSAIKPDFFIVGAPKCGTTALSDYLGAHPEIFMGRKEMHFFGRDLRFAPHFYRRDEREYLAAFADWNGQKRVGEASVWYLFSETAAAEIKAFNPHARIIVMLREPVAMMHSMFNFFRHDGNESLATFAEALAAEGDRRAGRQIARQSYLPQGLAYRVVAHFTEQVKRYFEVFGRERVHLIWNEDLAAHPAAVYRDTLNFLEVDATWTLPEFPRVNQGQEVKNRLLQFVLNEPRLRSALLTVRPMLPAPAFNVFHKIDRTLRRCNASKRKPPALEPELTAQLRREFAPEIERLSALTGRDLTHWHLEKPSRQQAASALANEVTH